MVYNLLGKVDVIMAILDIKNLSFAYKKNQVISDISYTFENGEIYSILGHNGAGKTTLIRLCMGILKRQGGEVIWTGCPTISYVPDQGGLFDFLTVKENLETFYKLHLRQQDLSFTRFDELLSKWGLLSKRDSRVDTLSMGQKQRVSLIVAGINDPDIIFLDEPSSSIDITSQEMLNDYLLDLKKHGKTIITATHDIHLIEKISDKIIILENGVIHFAGNMDEIENLTKLYKKYTQGGKTDDN